MNLLVDEQTVDERAEDEVEPADGHGGQERRRVRPDRGDHEREAVTSRREQEPQGQKRPHRLAGILVAAHQFDDDQPAELEVHEDVEDQRQADDQRVRTPVRLTQRANDQQGSEPADGVGRDARTDQIRRCGDRVSSFADQRQARRYGEWDNGRSRSRV
jgi:hypothetical protein